MPTSQESFLLVKAEIKLSNDGLIAHPQVWNRWVYIKRGDGEEVSYEAQVKLERVKEARDIETGADSEKE